MEGRETRKESTKGGIDKGQWKLEGEERGVFSLATADGWLVFSGGYKTKQSLFVFFAPRVHCSISSSHLSLDYILVFLIIVACVSVAAVIAVISSSFLNPYMYSVRSTLYNGLIL